MSKRNTILRERPVRLTDAPTIEREVCELYFLSPFANVAAISQAVGAPREAVLGILQAKGLPISVNFGYAPRINPKGA